MSDTKTRLLSSDGRLELLAEAAEIARDESSTYLDIERAKLLRQCALSAHQLMDLEDAEALIEKARKVRAELTGAAPSKASTSSPAKGTRSPGGVH